MSQATRFSRVYFALGVMFSLILYTDLYVFGLYDWVHYPKIMLGTIGYVFALSFLVYRKWLTPILSFDLLILGITSYSALLTYFMHFSYSFAFIQIYFFSAITYPGKIWRFGFNLLYTTLIGFFVTEWMPEPKLVVSGETIKPYLSNVLLIASVMSFICYWFFNKQREEISRLNERFMDLGRESAFLLHELKSPLNRLIVRAQEAAPRDASFVRLIIEGVEFIMAGSKAVSMDRKINWDELEGFLNDYVGDLCQEFEIRLRVEMLGGWNSGHQESLFLMIKNLVKNAIEASVEIETERKVEVVINQSSIVVKNKGMEIVPNLKEKMFQPFISSKSHLGERKNFGIGLFFVQSVARAHGAKVDYTYANGWSEFSVNKT